MKKTITVIAVIIVIAVAAYVYVTRAPSAPSVDINTVSAPVDIQEGDVYRISQDGSLVEFRIYELLRGNPFTVVGTTTQIAGDIAVQGNSITIGTIRINARTFVTDNANRNGAIARTILRSENPENEFIVFEPSSVTGGEGFSASGSANLQVSGNLTISGITKPETFSVSLLRKDGVITGTASSTISRSDFNLIIPSLPFIADVPNDFDVSARITAVSASE